MKLNATWSTLSLLAGASIVAASVGFAGCTVTSGTIDDDGGVVRPQDGGRESSTSDSGGDAQQGPACEGNQQTYQFPGGEGCQTCLEENCCTQLKGCFNLGVDAGDINCNEYAPCIVNCAQTDGGQQCEDECV